MISFEVHNTHAYIDSYIHTHNTFILENLYYLCKDNSIGKQQKYSCPRRNHSRHFGANSYAKCAGM